MGNEHNRFGIYSRRRRGELGNVFFTLFGAVAVVGVLGAGIMATMRGPLSTMVEVNRREQAKAELRVASNLILVNSDDESCEGVGFGDGYTEAPDPAAGAGPTGGGVLPSNVGTTRTDPWGNMYGYCSWNHGPGVVAADSAACGSRILAGSNSTTNEIAVAVISAGPNGNFETDCNNDSAPDSYIAPDGGGGDDIVVTLTYDQAISGSGGLWTPQGANVAEIARDLDVQGTGTSQFDGALSVTGTGTFNDVLAANRSMLLPLDTTAGFGNADCNGGNANLIRINTAITPRRMEICDGTNWQSAGSIWGISGTDLFYTGGEVGIGTNSPDDALDVVGTAQITGNTALGADLGVNGATTLTGSLTANGTSGFNDSVVITSTNTTATPVFTVNQSGPSEIFRIQSDGNVGIGTGGSTNDALDVSGAIDLTEALKIDGINTLYTGPASTSDTILLGQSAGANVDGNNNTIIGAGAAGTLTTGTGNIVIGQGSDVFANSVTDNLVIGSLLQGDLANGRIGIGFGAGTDVSSFNDTLEVNGNADFAGTLNVTGTSTLGDNVTITADTNDGSTDPLTIYDSDTNTVFTVNSDGRLDATDVFIDGSKDLDPGGTCASGSFSRWDGNSWQCIAFGPSGGGDGVGGDGLPEVLANDASANNIAITDLADPTNAQDAATKNYVDTQLGALASDRIQDTDNNTFIDVDTAGDGSANTTIFQNAGAESARIDATGNLGVGTNNPTSKITILDGDLAVREDDDGNNAVRVGAGLDVGWVALYNAGTLNTYINSAVGAPSYFNAGPVVFGNTTGDASARVQIDSTSQGFLAPRMTISARDAITTPATGLLVFATDAGDNGIFQFYDGSAWIDVGAGGAEGTGIWQEDGTNDYIEYDDTLGGIRIGRVTGQPAPATDWQLDVTNSVVYTASNTVAIGSGTVSGSLQVDVTGNIGATQYCDADGNNCFTAATVSGGGGGLWTNNTTHISRENVHVLNTGQTIDTASLNGGTSGLIWDTDNNALRAGAVSGTQWDDTNIGARSLAVGLDNRASGANSVALGNTNVASGDNSFTVGQNNGALANNSIALGTSVSASQNFSYALGRDVTVSGTDSMGIGLGIATDPHPLVSGSNSLGIFLGDQGSVDLSDSNTFSIMGASGGVGIGTVTPSTDLSVLNNQSSPTSISVINTDTNINAAANVLLTSDAGNAYFDMTSIAGGAHASLYSDSAGGLWLSAENASGSLSFRTAGFVERMRIDQSGDIVMSGTGALQFHSGTTAQRPGTPLDGMIRFNSDDDAYEVYSTTATDWIQIVVNGSVAGGVAGNDTEVQFNDNGSPGADPGLTYDQSTDTLTVASVINVGEKINITGVAGAAPSFADLNDLDDVSVAGPTDGYLLSYNSGTGTWVAIDPSTLTTSYLDRIQDTGDGNTYIDVDTDDADGNNTISFVTDGAEEMFIASGGGIGFGINTPASDVHLHETGNFASFQFTNGSSGTTGADGFILSLNQATDMALWLQEDMPMTFGTNSLERMRLTNTGDLGLGTNDVDLSGIATPFRLRVAGSNAKTVAAETTLGFFGTTENNNPIGLSFSTVGGAASTDYQARISALEAGVSPIDLILQATGGDVGIGTTSPGLSSATQALTISDLNSNGTAALELQGNISGTDGEIGGLGYYNSGTLLGGISVRRMNADDSGSMIFTITDGGTEAEAMRILRNGHIGIGTVAPNVRLGVNGTLRVADGGEACDANREGGIRYEAGSDTFFFCATAASGWESISLGSGVSVINDLGDAFHDTTTDFDGDLADNDDNIAIGHTFAALDPTDPGARNTALGTTAGAAITEADNATVIGYEAGVNLTTGADNTFIGREAGQTITTGRQNTFIGSGSGAAGSGGNSLFNTAVGHNALRDVNGSHNVAMGQSAAVNTEGDNNTALGANALFRNTTGNNNVAVGFEALQGTANGAYANNTALGVRAGLNIEETGNNNLLLGYQAGDLLTTGTDNIIIGYDVDPTSATATNELNIGNLLYGDLANNVVGIGITAPGAELHAHSSGYTSILLTNTTSGTTGSDGFEFGLGNTVLNFELNENLPMQFWTNATQRLRIDAAGGVGLGSAAAANNDSSALLELGSTTQGFLPPRMTTTERDNIASPATGLHVYNTTTNTFDYYNGSAWVSFATLAGSALWTDNTTYISRTGDVLVDGTFTGTPSVPVSGTGTRMFFDVDTAAFRAGRAGGAHWDNANIGDFSIALGVNGQASGAASIVLGSGIASSTNSVSIGNGNLSSGQASVAMGDSTDVTGTNSFGFGLGFPSGTNPVVSGNNSFGIFMGDQSGYDLATANRMALVGGDLLIDDDGTAGSQGCIRYVEGTGLQYSNDCSTFANLGSVAPGVLELNDLSDVSTNYTTTFNMFLGSGAGNASATGGLNIALGQDSMTNIDAGTRNVAIGTGALISAVDNDNNVAIGDLAATALNTGSNNVAVGRNALASGTSAFESVAIGAEALANSGGSADYSVAIGYGAAQQTGTDGNVAVGRLALGNAGGISGNRTAVGHEALRYTSGSGNVALGSGAGLGVSGTSTASNSVFIGNDAGGGITTGSSNVFVGRSAGLNTTDGNNNVYIGDLAGTSNNSSQNTTLGFQSGQNMTGGFGNTYLGYQAGVTNVDGDGNIMIGVGTNAPTVNTNDWLNIGDAIEADMANREVFIDAPAAAPADGDLNNGAWTLWLDETNDQFELKAKKADGTIITQTVGQAAPGSIPAAGSDRQIQFNDSGSLGASSLYSFTATNQLLIGTADATGTLATWSSPGIKYVGQAGSDDLWIMSYQDGDTTKSDINFMKARGTEAVPTVIADGHMIGELRWTGYDGDEFVRRSASIYGIVNGTVANDDVPVDLVFDTGNGPAASTLERMRITSTGRIGMGTSTPIADLEIHKAGTNNYPSIVFSAEDITTPGFTNSASIGDLANTAAFGRITNNMGTNANIYTGGIRLDGLTSDGTNDWNPVAIVGTHGGTAPTEAAVVIASQKFNGTNNRAALTGNEPVLDVRNNYNGGNLLMRLEGAGNLGLGESNPDSMIHLKSSSATRLRLQNEAVGGSSDIVFEEQNQGDNFIIQYSGVNNNLTFTGNDGGLAMAISRERRSVAIGGTTDTLDADNVNIPDGTLTVENGALCIDDGGTNCDDVARNAGDIYALGTGTILMPAGTTAQRPVAPLDGMIRFNAETDSYEVYSSTATDWVAIVTGGSINASASALALNDLSDAAKDLTQNNFFLAHEGGVNIGAENLQNTAVGIGALDGLTNTGSTGLNGDANTAFGYNALSSVTTGHTNTGIGNRAGQNITTGLANLAIGSESLFQVTTGGDNVGVGNWTLNTLNSGSDNTALGVGAGWYIAGGGNNNVFLGQRAARGNTTDFNYDGDDNVIIGSNAAIDLDGTNSQNTIIGSQSAATLTGGGSGNILIGYGTDVTTTTSSNELNIGNLVYGDLANSHVFIGDLRSRQNLGSSFQNVQTYFDAGTTNQGDVAFGVAADNATRKADLDLFKARGTVGSESAVQSADELGAIRFTGYDGNAFQTRAQITGEVDGTVGIGDVPTAITFRTSSTAALTAATERMRISSDGFVGIGKAAPTKHLDIEADVAGGNLAAMRNLSNSGYASIDFFDSAGTFKGAFGYANPSVGATALADSMYMSTGSDDAFTILQGGSQTLKLERTTGLGLGSFVSDTIDSSLHIQSGDIRIDGGAGNQAGCFRYNDTTDVLQYSNDCSTFVDFGGAGSAGSDTQVIYNDGGTLTGEAAFTYDDANDTMTIASVSATDRISLTPKTSVGTPNGLAINDLADVDTSGLTDGQLLAYNNTSGNWEPVAAGSGGLWTDNTTHITYENFDILKAGQTMTSAGFDGVATTAMRYHTDKAALRIGTSDINSWNEANIGNNSLGVGNHVYVAQANSFATGFQSNISGSGSNSAAIGGVQPFVSGDASIAMGSRVTVSGDYSIGLGVKTNASSTTTLSGDQSFGVFLGDQSIDFAANNTIGLFGGNIVIDPNAPATQLTAASAIHLASGDIRLDGGTGNQAGCLRYDDSTDRIQFSHDCSVFTDMGSSTVGGSDTQVHFNNSGVEDGDAGLTYNAASDTLNVGSTINVGSLLNIGSTTGAAAPTGVTNTVSLNLDDLGDVGASGATNGQALVYNSTSGEWEPGAPVGGGLWTQNASDIYYSAGNVGIGGDTTPDAELDVDSADPAIHLTDNDAAADGNTSARLDFRNSINQRHGAVGFFNNQTLSLVNDISGADIDINTEDDIIFSTGSTPTEVVRIDETGSVGIGTSTPSNELEVEGDIRANSLILDGVTGNAPTFVTPTLALNDVSDVDLTGATNGEVLTYNSTSGNWESQASGGLWSSGTGENIYYDGTTPQVGIGTTTPSYMLHVEDGDILIGDTTDTPRKLFIQRNGTMMGKLSADDSDLTLAAMNGEAIRITPDGGITDGGLFIADSGNVGLGMTNPAAKLDLGDGVIGSPTFFAYHSGNVKVGMGVDMTGNTWEANLFGQANGTNGHLSFGFIDSADGTTYTEEMRLTETGYLGINNNAPDVELDVTGDIEYTGTLTDVSDARLKSDIEPLIKYGSLLDRIDQIETVSFVMLDDEDKRKEFGVIAQQLETVFPELVHTAQDEMGTKSVNYVGLIAPMIEATKELKKENAALKEEIASTLADTAEIKQSVSDLSKQVELLNKATAQKVEKASIIPLSQGWLFLIIGFLSGLCMVLVVSRKNNQVD